MANQLEGIIKTGSYIFKQSGSSLGITLEYVPTTRLAAHHLLSPVEGKEFSYCLTHQTLIYA